MSKLFTSYELGTLHLKNRVVMAPLTRSRATADHVPTPIMAEYYRQRASAGLIISEGTSPSPNGVGYPRIPGLYTDEQVEAWRRVTAAVHEACGKIFAQIMHTGRVGHPLNMPAGSQVLAPSAIGLESERMWTDQEGMQSLPQPAAMTLDQVKEAKEEFVRAARNAIRAGFDGVELHGANGYLLEQFLAPSSNQRTDEYGGSMEARAKFVLEIAAEVSDEVGPEKVGIRLSPYGVFNEMPQYDEIDATYDFLAQKFGEMGLAYIHLVDHAAMGAPAVPEPVKRSIQRSFGRDIILSGGYNKERADQDIDSGNSSLVAFGRPFISNPDFVERMKENIPLADAKPELFYTPGSEGYSDYPSASQTDRSKASVS